ncbi:hypothetical protein L5515_015473 [Caenorhabditis briggsae]|uniref:Uncharacterized protein n=1 Tax=Caenorhabditis briggsae TaxID=6238 RepID=A0AAE9EEY5_CAEBR|nr:hypothetical protein L5515_015473 [Caenorhabditis briggsae]
MSDVFDQIEIINLDDVDSGYGRSISNNDDDLEAEIDDLEVEPWDPTIYEEAFAEVASWMEEEKIVND